MIWDGTGADPRAWSSEGRGRALTTYLPQHVEWPVFRSAFKDQDLRTALDCHYVASVKIRRMVWAIAFSLEFSAPELGQIDYVEHVVQLDGAHR